VRALYEHRRAGSGRFTNTAGPEEIGKQIGRPLGVQIRESADRPTRVSISGAEAVTISFGGFHLARGSAP
jgi:hypothetical protein